MRATPRTWIQITESGAEIAGTIILALGRDPAKLGEIVELLRQHLEEREEHK